MKSRGTIRIIVVIAATTCLEFFGLGTARAATEENCVKGVDPIECMVSTVEVFLPTCQMVAKVQFEAAGAGLEPQVSYRDCIVKARKALEQTYANALAAGRRRKTEREVKEYYAMAMAAFSGIEPAADEPKITYRQRQASTMQALRVQGERAKLK